MDKNPLLEAISIAGSQAKLARLVGVNQQDISYWLRKARKGIPLERVPDIERATGGRVTRYDLRPDFFEHPQDHQPSLVQEQPCT